MADLTAVTDKPEEHWMHKYVTVMWAMVVAAVAVWRYTVPAFYNMAAIDRMTDVEPSLIMLYKMPSPEIEDERLILVHVGLAMVVTAFVIFFPSAVRRHLTWWTIIGVLVGTGLTAFGGLVYVPYSTAFWNTAVVIMILLAVFAACNLSAAPSIPKQSGIISRVINYLRFAMGYVSDRLARPYCVAGNTRTVINGVAVIGLLLSSLCLIPATCGRWKGTAKAKEAQVDVAVYLLGMKDHQSVLHEELVDVLFQNREYLVVRLSQQVPHPKVCPEGPTTLPVKDLPGHYSFNLPSPMLVSRNCVESITFNLSPSAMRKSFDSAMRDVGLTITQTDYQIRRIPGGGYGVNIELKGKFQAGRADQTTSQPTSIPAKTG